VAGYLYFGGAGFLLLPSVMVKVFLAEGIYSMLTLRLLGGVMLAMGMLVSAMIEQRVEGLFRQTIMACIPMLIALAYVYYDSLDRMWAILLGIVLGGWLASILCYWQDRREASRRGGRAGEERRPA